jgi:hypothetical protein
MSLNIEDVNPETLAQFPEPAIPPGMKASEWYQWSEIQLIARMLSLSKAWDPGENFYIHGLLEHKIKAGEVQRWKLGAHQGAPTYYRLVGLEIIPASKARTG